MRRRLGRERSAKQQRLFVLRLENVDELCFDRFGMNSELGNVAISLLFAFRRLES
jgi:hypothetical protein